MLVPRAMGFLKANHFTCCLGQQSHAEKGISNWTYQLCEQNVGMKRLRTAFWSGDLDNTESCGEWLTWFLPCFYSCRLAASISWFPPVERIANMGNVYVKTVILFPFCSGVRYFSMRRFQEHTIRWEIILKTVLFPSHCDLATSFDSK